jgi:alpha-beta hydrolase superfamily lysophospholipase
MTGSRTEAIAVSIDGVALPGDLTVPRDATGVVVFAHGSGSSRLSTRNRSVARHLEASGCATLLVDLLTEGEAADRGNVFDVALLATRLRAAHDTVHAHLPALPVGSFGASTGAAAALWAAAEPGNDVAAVVSRGGRPDLAGDRLPDVRAPTLLVVGGNDPQVLALNLEAADRLTCEHEVVVVAGATHLFEEPGALETVADLAVRWFVARFAAGS